MGNLAIFVLGVIIVVNIVAVVVVLTFGNRHDHHHDVHEETQAQSLVRLKAQYDFPERAAQPQAPAQMEAAPAPPESLPAQSEEALADQLAEAVAQLPDEDKIASNEQ